MKAHRVRSGGDYGVDPIPVVVGYGSTHKVRAHVEHDVNDAHDEACDGRAQRSSSGPITCCDVVNLRRTSST